MSQRLRDLKDWILRPVDRERPPEEFFDELAQVLTDAGFPLWRMGTVLISHDPDASVLHMLWARNGRTQIRRPKHAVTQTPSFIGTPVEHVLKTGEYLRLRLDDAATARFPILQDVRTSGGTDYFIAPVSVRDALSYANTEHAGRTWISFATNTPEGFSNGDIADLRAFSAALSVRISLETSKQTARSLLGAYVGLEAARHVLRGHFRRGTAQQLRAVIWYCDMRGFTALSDRRPPLEVVGMLDRYFDAVATPVHLRGGEILKFIGDAVLAIFPLDGRKAEDVCAEAIAATRDAITGLHALNETLMAEGKPELGLGIALHAGDVAYGNIGAAHRLDFTVIGAPVNEVCRVEPLTRALNVDAVLTRTFVELAGLTGAVSLGKHTLQGVSEPDEVFALPPP